MAGLSACAQSDGAWKWSVECKDGTAVHALRYNYMYDTHVSNLEISRAVVGGNYGRGRGRDNSGHLDFIH